MSSTAEPAHDDAASPATPKEAAHHRSHAMHGKKRTRTHHFRNVFLVALAVSAAVWGVRFGTHLYRYEETDDAYVTGHLHTVSPRANGEVKDVLVHDNQYVHVGDTLVTLDATSFQIAVDRARAALLQARAQGQQIAAAVAEADAMLAAARARVDQANAQVAQTAALLKLASMTLARNEQLVHENGAAQSELDEARSGDQAAAAAHNAARANLVAARAAVDSAVAAENSARAQSDAASGAVQAAEANLRDAQLQLSYTAITAPADGRVGSKNVEQGNRVQAGQALVAIAEPNAWVVANFKETQLADMRVGQPAELTIDAIPGTTFHGRVDSFSPASGAEFALLPPDNATGNFNKVVQRIPVKITLDPESLKETGNRLRLGLSVVVNVRVR